MDFRTGTYWHQGLFLQPQHFQRLEQTQQFYRKPLYEAVSPHFWGIGQLDLAPEALNARLFEVRAARVIFQDQTYLEFPGNAVIASRSFDKLWASSDAPLDVYLGLKKLSAVAPNVTVVDSLNETAGVSSRLISLGEAQQVPDLYGSGPAAMMPTVLYAPKIFFGSEIETLADYDLIPLAQLVRDIDTIRLVPQAVPPSYALSGARLLSDVLNDIRDDMAGRLRQITEYKIPRDMQSQELDPDYLLLLQAVQALNRLVPLAVHLTETEQIHPWTVYGFLRMCVGELSTFSDRTDVLGRQGDKDEGLPRYDHLNLGPCFLAARKLISQLLSEISVGPEFYAFLEPRDAFLVGVLPSQFFASRNRFYLVTKTGSNNERLSQDFVKTVRIASPAQLPGLIDLALPGIELIEVLTPPQGLPQRPNTRYYRIEQMAAAWEAVEQEGELAMFWAQAPDDLRVEVVVLRG
jgi:type VI secretion system protein ImpJ